MRKPVCSMTVANLIHELVPANCNGSNIFPKTENVNDVPRYHPSGIVKVAISSAAASKVVPVLVRRNHQH